MSEAAEEKEKEARDSAEGFPQGTPDWFKIYTRSNLPKPAQKPESDGKVILYSSSRARQEREGNIVRESHFRSEVERLTERGERFHALSRGAMFAESDKEERARDASYDAITTYRGWDDAGRHLIGNGRITSLLKELMKLVLPGIAVAFLAVVVFDPTALGPFERQIGPWLNDPFHEAWLFALFAVILAIVYFMRRRGSI